MTSLIRHRGPDDEGFALFDGAGSPAARFGGGDTPADVYAEPTPYSPARAIGDAPNHPARVALGHRRLSIIDLSPHGHQPMSTPDGRYWIAYNGEIYNYLELRDELADLGAPFVSHCDTEVILAAYREWGPDCLRRFNGMWAFAIYDVRDRRLFVARDRYGVKPLYYWRSAEGVFAFASEIKALTGAPGWRARLNPSRVYDFLRFGVSDHTAETLFDGVQQLPGGSYLEVQVDDVALRPPQTRAWYDLKPAGVPETLEEAAAEFRALFRDSVRLRLRSDVPVGTGLSGGIDSSSVVCTVAELLRTTGSPTEQHTFSACAEDARFDERRFIDRVLERTGARAHYTFPSLDLMLDQIRTLVWHHDEPLAGATVFAEWEVFRLVASTPVKVTLDGHGADELLGGYHSFFRPYLAGLLAARRWRDVARQAAALRRVHGFGRSYLPKAAADYYLPRPLKRRLQRASGRESSHDWIDVDALGLDPADSLEERLPRAESFREFSLQQLLATSLPPQLRSCDRDSMAHGIESRAPFLDFRVVEYALGCADEFKLDNGITKVILRRAMEPSLPPEIVRRYDKMGFVTPEYAWMTEGHPDLFSAMVDRAVDRAAGIVQPEAGRHAKAIIRRERPFDLMVWRLITFAEWLEVFEVG